MFIKKGVSLISAPITHKLYRESHLNYAIKTFKWKPFPKDDNRSLVLAMEWLKNAAEVTRWCGVSFGYSLRFGWGPPYPETTGYIIETLWDYYKLSVEGIWRELAIRLSEWELGVQLHSGAFPAYLHPSNIPEVFNTGMVIFGLVKTYENTGEKRYLKSARDAGNWLVSIQESNGQWIKCGSPYVRNPNKSYHARVSWGLLRLFQITSDERYMSTAIKNLDWVCSNAERNGFIRNMDFANDQKPLTHSMCYTYRGLFESGLILNEKRYIDLAIYACNELLKSYARYGYLFCNYKQDWTPANKYKGLVGSAQFAQLFLRIYEYNGNREFYRAGCEILDFVKSYQPDNSQENGIKGGLAGSIPIYANYFPTTFLNFGAKFLADAIMCKMNIEKRPLNTG